MSQVDTPLQRIELELRDRTLNYPDWILSDFQTILRHAPIREILDRTPTDPIKKYDSIHGADHGLVVAYNALSLFKMIHLNFIESDYVKERNLGPEHVLFSLLVASYIHDVSRFYRHTDREEDRVRAHEEIENAVRMLLELVRDHKIMRAMTLETITEILDCVKDLCMHIDIKEQESEKTEHAIIKLADLLDCGKSRTYSESQIPELGKERGEQMRKILQNDEHPEKHFGFLSIEATQLEWNGQENIFEITLTISDYAAAAEIKRILNILELNEKKGSESVKELSRRIRLFIKDPKTRFVLYPKNIIRLPGARFRSITYEIDVQNKTGDAQILSTFDIENISNKAGISSHTFRMWGLEKTQWGKTEGVIVKVTDADNRELETRYDGAERGGKGHTWTTLFKEAIELNHSINLIGRYSWKKFINVKEDEFEQTIGTPTNRLEVKIFFPKEIRKEDIDAALEIRPSESRVPLFHVSAKNAIYYDEIREKVFIHLIMENLITGYTYRVFWKTKD
jgi:hypothetical protein